MKIEAGKRYMTRAGDVVKVTDIVTTAITKARVARVTTGQSVWADTGFFNGGTAPVKSDHDLLAEVPDGMLRSETEMRAMKTDANAALGFRKLLQEGNAADITKIPDGMPMEEALRIADEVDAERRRNVNDPVNRPAHYTGHPSGVECIQITEHMSFCRGNAMKYIWRAGDKGNEVQDLEKAIWYLQREIGLIRQKTS